VNRIVPVVAVAVAAYVLLPRAAQVTASASVLRRATWPWLVGVAGAAGLTYGFAAAALIAASGRRLGIRRTYAVQLGAACANRLTPAGVGAAATNMRYLEQEGLDRPSAVTAVGLAAVAGFGTHLIGTVAAVALLQGRVAALHAPDIDNAWPYLALLAVAAVLVWRGHRACAASPPGGHGRDSAICGPCSAIPAGLSCWSHAARVSAVRTSSGSRPLWPRWAHIPGSVRSPGFT
jgi:hypothetical protein